MRMEKGEHNRGRDMPRSCTYAAGNTTQDKHIEFHGISEG